MKKSPLPLAQIQARIHIVRGKRVMLDADLARFYGVTTRDLNKAVTRNIDRFPDDFAFHVLKEETQNLMFQDGTSSSQATAVIDDKRARYAHGGTRKPARAFTEQGVAMLASVLHSPRAVAVSVALVRAFVQLRELLPRIANSQPSSPSWNTASPATTPRSTNSSRPSASSLSRRKHLKRNWASTPC